MGELRDKFWELELGELTRAEWEALCDGCGRCCLHKIEDADTGEISGTNVACKLLDTETARCSDYRNRTRLCTRLPAPDRTAGKPGDLAPTKLRLSFAR